MYALGRLCITWAALDRQLTDLLGDVLGVSRGAAATLGMVENVAPRCEALKKLSYERGYQPEWCELFEKLMDNVVKLASERNRFVHDFWAVSEGSLERLDKRARFESLGAGFGKKLVFETWHKHLPREVDELCVRVATTILLIQVARKDVLNVSGRGPLPEPTLLSKLRDMIVPQEHSPPAKKARGRPPQPSAE